MEKKNLLVIDDDQAFLNVMQEVLEMEGYECHAVAETADFASLVRSVKPDLILLDYCMPGRDGADLCRILQDNPDLSLIPVVLLSAYQSEQLPLHRLHFSVFVPKPFDLWDLLACLAELLRHCEAFAA